MGESSVILVFSAQVRLADAPVRAESRHEKKRLEIGILPAPQRIPVLVDCINQAVGPTTSGEYLSVVAEHNAPFFNQKRVIPFPALKNLHADNRVVPATCS